MKHGTDGTADGKSMHSKGAERKEKAKETKEMGKEFSWGIVGHAGRREEHQIHIHQGIEQKEEQEKEKETKERAKEKETNERAKDFPHG